VRVRLLLRLRLLVAVIPVFLRECLVSIRQHTSASAPSANTPRAQYLLLLLLPLPWLLLLLPVETRQAGRK